MRYRKTPCDKRKTYKQYDDDGNFVAEFDPKTDSLVVDVTRRSVIPTYRKFSAY